MNIDENINEQQQKKLQNGYFKKDQVFIVLTCRGFTCCLKGNCNTGFHIGVEKGCIKLLNTWINNDVLATVKNSKISLA